MKVRRIGYCLIFLLTSLLLKAEDKGGKLRLWYDKPAKIWNEALPIGNGRIAAMVHGDPAKEIIQLNEATFWSGGPSRNDNPKSLKALNEVRKLIFDGKYHDAEKLVNQNMKAEQLHGSMFQVVGNLNLLFDGHEEFTSYYRELDLEKAVFNTTYNVNGIIYKREVFASQPDQVIVVRLTASEPGKLSFTALMNSPLQKSAKALNATTLEMTGLSGTHEGVVGQVKFNARTKIINKGGDTSIDSGKIKVNNADEVLILISIATNFVDYKTLTADEVQRCINYLSEAEKKSYVDLLDAHMAAYQKYFNRVSLDLGTSPAAKLPTDVRVRDFSQNHDPELVSMYFQFGRYLLISSSQPGGNLLIYREYGMEAPILPGTVSIRSISIPK